MRDNEYKSSLCIRKSLIYERASGRLGRFLSELGAEKNKNEIEAKNRGDEPDEFYPVLIDHVRRLKDEINAESERLWKQAEDAAVFTETSFENLANAVIMRAVNDYELGICGFGTDIRMEEIRRFAEDGADVYSSVNLKSILHKIEAVKPVFMQILQEHGAEIIEETNANRKTHTDMRFNKYRCPMCGGGLYAYGKEENGRQVIKCSGCYMIGFYYEKPDKGEEKEGP